ncbi:carbohydrate ABC transporter permease [uncultured Amnibacterium sp.]|uniref:carbohydrate ABC transporter permease n=1 Tax=uncultured Amnibacterium sp. TaxID=1631851 RepID=UPI0035C9DFD2
MTITRATRVRVQKAGTIAALCGAAAIAAFPILWMLLSSFKTNTEVFAYPPALLTDNFSLNAYVAVFADPTKLRFFINSYVVAIVVTLATLLISILAAYAFSRYEFRGKGLMSIVIIGVQAVPPITLLIPYFSLIVALKLYNSYGGLILTYMVFTVPYAVIMMTSYFNTLPRELDEAVKVDGAGPLTALFRILVPVAMPGIVSVGVYTFMIAWNEYLFALTLTRTDDMRTLPIGIQLLLGQNNQEWAQLMAMSLLGILPVLLLFLIFQRWFIGGLTSGAVKS